MECGRLEPYSKKKEIIKLCEQAKEYNFGIVYANLSYIPLIVNELNNTDILVGVPISFPFGATSMEIKIQETKQAINEGAKEIDMVMNIQRFKSGEYNYVEDDISGIVEEAKNYITKVIIETCYLDKNEIIRNYSKSTPSHMTLSAYVTNDGVFLDVSQVGVYQFSFF